MTTATTTEVFADLESAITELENYVIRGLRQCSAIAADATQDIVWKFSRESRPLERKLMMVAVRNRCRDYNRRGAKWEQAIDGELETKILAPGEKCNDALSDAIELTTNVLEGLKRDVMLGFLSGDSVDELADRLGISLSLAYKCKSQALAILRDAAAT